MIQSTIQAQFRYSGNNFSQAKIFMECCEKHAPLFLDRVIVAEETLYIEYRYTSGGTRTLEMKRGDVLTLMRDGTFRQDIVAVECGDQTTQLVSVHAIQARA